SFPTRRSSDLGCTMNAAPDPQTVREIARKHLAADAITIDAAEIVTAAKAHLGANALAEDLHVWSQALRDELDGVTLTVVMSWPDEQPAAEQDGNKPSAPPPGLPCRATDMHNGDRHHCTLNKAAHRAHQCGDCGHVWAEGGGPFE